MARLLRIEFDGALYHVTSRGNERKAIFKDDTIASFFWTPREGQPVLGSSLSHELFANHSLFAFRHKTQSAS